MTPVHTESLALATEIVGAAVLHDVGGADWRQALCVAIAEALDQWARQERERAAGIAERHADIMGALKREGEERCARTIAAAIQEGT